MTWILAILLAFGLLQLMENAAEIFAVYLSLFLSILSLWPSHWRLRILKAVCLLLACLILSLWAHLLFDHFHYAYVWLYSAPDLATYLKLSNLWGGEQGTILFLAFCLSAFSLRMIRYGGWTVIGVILLSIPFLIGLVFWHPFQVTTADQLAHAPYQGMNAHLTKFWMAIHPPLIFITYLLLLVPVGAAVQALVKGTGPWKEISLTYSRWAWVILSAGMISGMWWAYEDYFYGQFWHWDPVQTASFVVWCFLTAYIHGLRIYRPDGQFARILPFLSIMTGAMAIGSMLVTRNGELVSSHRYIGETSVVLLAVISVAIVMVAVIALILSYRRELPKRASFTESRLMIQLAIWGFVIIGLMGCYILGEAYVRALLNIPKDRPPLFFVLIANVSSADLVNLLQEQHKRWTVDNFSINELLVPVVFLVAMVGGHRFLPIHSFKIRLVITLMAAISCWMCAEYIAPLNYFYDGNGITSGATRRNFYLLNMLLVAVVYFSVASLLYALPIGVGKGKEKAYFNYIAPVGLIHMGVMIGLFAALSATILDSNIIRKITFPNAYDRPIKITDDLNIRIGNPQSRMISEGYYSAKAAATFRSVTDIQLSLMGENGGQKILDQGQTLYQDDRLPVASEVGAIRQYCETVDYRFARISRDNSHMLHPFIYRGLGYDLQIWLPAINYLDYDQDGQYIGAQKLAQKPAKTSTEYNLVIKKFPMMTWLWVGMGISLLAGIYYASFARRKGTRLKWKILQRRSS